MCVCVCVCVLVIYLSRDKIEITNHKGIRKYN